MIRVLYFFVFFFLISCSNVKLSEPLPEPKRESIFGGPLKFSTETGTFSTGDGKLSSLQNSNSVQKEAAAGVDVTTYSAAYTTGGLVIGFQGADNDASSYSATYTTVSYTHLTLPTNREV